MEWYCWYPEAYKADTMHLTAEQDGIYRRLIDHYMETGQAIPDNDNAIARAAGIDLEQWQKSAHQIRPFFTLHRDGKLHLKKCDTELSRQMAKSVSHQQRGILGAKSRWGIIKQNQYADSSSHSLAIAKPIANDSRGDKIREERKKEKLAYASKKSVTLLELSVDHVREWLLQKRSAGRYLEHDEGFILEYFRNYCLAKNPKYRDYVAAYRNAFEWKACQPQQLTKGNDYDKRSKWDIEAANILEQRKIRDNTALPDDAFKSPEKLR